jgi:hypothetical protein
VLTERARQWAFAQVGGHDATVSGTATTLGVAWGTVWAQVVEQGTPLVDDPARLDPPAAPVTAVGVDETAFLRATGQHPTQFATGIADLTPGRPARLLDVVEGRSGPALAGWLADRDPAWRQRVATASLDPFRGYASALSAQLPDAVRVLDPFHVVKLALTCVDDIRRRVQQEQTGHRGLRDDPLFGIRRVLRRRRDRLSVKAAARLRAGLIAGDPDGEVTVAWTVAQDVMAIYAESNPDQARHRAEQLINDLRDCPILELARARPHPARLADRTARPIRPSRRIKRTDREPQPKDQEHQAEIARIPQLQQLPTATLAQPRPHPRRSTRITDQNPRSQVRCVEPV